MDVVTLSNIMKYYKRPEIQMAIVDGALNKEAVGSYGGKGYGRRPDVLQYPSDVMALVKKGVTSFHTSEEIWINPLQIKTGMPRKDMNSIRKGWDLVLDIDCPYWELAKITTMLFVDALKAHGVKAVSVKFSGNKGFHIGVPFESFPERVQDKDAKDLFPEGPRMIALYLLDYIDQKGVSVDGDKVVFGGKYSFTLQELQQMTGMSVEELTKKICTSCKKTIKKSKIETNKSFVCSKCGSQKNVDEEYVRCEKCDVLMEEVTHRKSLCGCGSNEYQTLFNPQSILEVDTVLIASRHLFRANYSFHEKSGLASIPIDPDRVMSFEKIAADPRYVIKNNFGFLERDNVERGEAARLLSIAMEHCARKESEKKEKEEIYSSSKTFDFEAVQEAVPEQCFPPCINIIFQGLQDGKKRAIFALVNFLSSVGWNYEQIEEYLKKWNENNEEPLREVYLMGQLRYHKIHRKKVLPPNCDNKAYYKDLGVCKPDNFCGKIKNPANYAIRKGRFLNAKKPKASSKKEGEKGASTA